MRKRVLALLLIVSLGVTGCGQMADTDGTDDSHGGGGVGTKNENSGEDTLEQEGVDFMEANYEGIETAANGAKISVHDPSIKVFDGKYYIYGSHMTGAVSEDMQTWEMIGDGYRSNNPLFTDLWASDFETFKYAGDYGDGTYSVWAEDVIYIKEMQKYVMYFSSSSSYIKSNISIATADAPEGPYTWQGALLYSGFTSEDIGETNVYDHVSEDDAASTYLKLSGAYDNNLWPNCIDPAPFYDEDGRLWMVYGSWSGGIFLLELDPNTGLIIHPEADEERRVDPYFGRHLMGGGHKSIEGPYIQYDAEAGYYYLYISYGELHRTGGYQIRVFRSETVDGDYVDMSGKFHTKGFNHSYFGLKLSGNYYMPSVKNAYMATGGQSTFIDEDAKRYICYHSRFENNREYHEPCVKQIFINAEGWPVLPPFTTKGETISETGYPKEDLIGEYYFINQEMDISDQIAQPVMITLNGDGSVSGSISGMWKAIEGTYYMHFSYGDVDYSGVFLRMLDQAGTEVMTFSAVGENMSVWGVKY